MSKTITAIVPVKANSERVPGKNMRLFNGRPLLHYILATLQEIPEISLISVNTDSDAAADYAGRFSKVKIWERPEELRGHHISMNSIIANELSHLEGDHFLQTHATNPLLGAETIRKAISAYFDQKEHDALFSVTSRRSRFYDDKSLPVNHNPKKLINTQDLAPLYEENSCLYLFSREAFHAGVNNRLGVSPAMFVTHPYESHDIDTEEDFVLAELLWKVINK